MSSGYLPLSRKVFAHDFWLEDRPFSKFEAWLDLLQTARYDKEETTDWIAGKPIKYGRGQLPASVRFLKERWNWGSNTKVEQFLKQLETRTMIKTEKGQGQTVVTICKYDDYNLTKENEKTAKGQQQRRKQGQEKDESNKDNKEEINTMLDFASFWLKYQDKKGSKKKAEEKWKLLTVAEKEDIMEGLPAYLSNLNLNFLPHATTFLNGRYWENEHYGEFNTGIVVKMPTPVDEQFTTAD